MEAWRESIPPEIFDWWEAYDRLEGEPYARIAEILKLGFATLANSWGAKIAPEDLEPAKSHDSSAAKGPAEVERMLRTAYGG